MNKKEISAEYIGENLILLNHATGKFYQLNSTATLIWEKASKNIKSDEIIKFLKNEYDINEEELEVIVSETMDDLQKKLLI